MKRIRYFKVRDFHLNLNFRNSSKDMTPAYVGIDKENNKNNIVLYPPNCYKNTHTAMIRLPEGQ